MAGHACWFEPATRPLKFRAGRAPFFPCHILLPRPGTGHPACPQPTETRKGRPIPVPDSLSGSIRSYCEPPSKQPYFVLCIRILLDIYCPFTRYIPRMSVRPSNPPFWKRCTIYSFGTPCHDCSVLPLFSIFSLSLALALSLSRALPLPTANNQNKSKKKSAAWHSTNAGTRKTLTSSSSKVLHRQAASPASSVPSGPNAA